MIILLETGEVEKYDFKDYSPGDSGRKMTTQIIHMATEGGEEM
jgi:hypothetical protein